MRCEDFTLSAPDGRLERAVGHRDLSGRDEFGGYTIKGRKPQKEEEVEVVFAVDPRFAGRTDLVLRYRDLPELPLEASKKVAGE
jgi:hypothetical protein